MHYPYPVYVVCIQVDDDNMSVSEPEGANEREARLAAELDAGDYYSSSAATGSGAYPTFAITSSNSHGGVHANPTFTSEHRPMSEPTPHHQNISTGAEGKQEGDGGESDDSGGLLSSIFKNLGGHLTQALADIDALVTGEGKQSKGDVCLMYPRRPVHR